jgi:glyoxylase-like metal-dependent hydrolase (beta-lactamase superfamily II)
MCRSRTARRARGRLGVRCLHTPGHAPDHLCFALAGTGVLFSGDHVMGWNTSVVAPPEGKMADYIRSLEKLIGRTTACTFRARRPVRGPAAAGEGLPAAPAHARERHPGMHPRRQRHGDGIVPVIYRGPRSPSSSTLRLFLCSRTLST